MIFLLAVLLALALVQAVFGVWMEQFVKLPKRICQLSVWEEEKKCFTATVDTSQNELAMAHALPSGIRLGGK